MSTTTTNYGLIKPDTTDPILIGQLNDNADAIDAALKENADAIENKPDAADIPTPSTAAPAMDGTAAAGTSTDYARADHVHPSDTSKQDTLNAAQLAAVNSGINSEKVAQYDSTTELEAKDRAALVELVDSGAKNLLKISATSQTISGVTFTVDSTNEIIINGTASSNIFYNIADNFELNAGSYIVNVPDGSTTSTYYIGLRDLDGGNYYLSSNNRTLTLEQKTQFSWIRIAIYSGYVFNNLLYEPMICTAEDYAISPKFVPYRPSYQELYERVVALEQANQ